MENDDKRLRELLIKATKDRNFRDEFLKDPAGVGKKNGVSLGDEHIEKIKRTAMFIDSLTDIRLPPGPIYYPLDPILGHWREVEMGRALSFLGRRIRFRPNVYPFEDIGVVFQGRE
ncbi:MAG: hypothetical protein J5U17_01880 [Candidatus Methanoperedens sp.]|nr:hypothetical protein [Candidatus Methanoperedens sp.]MCE8426946.1 hypothetical protein [Candidatus Methanoperedens sp.]